MSNDLAPLEAYASGLVASLSPSARRVLAWQIAKGLRTSQAKRIASQETPDGEAYEPRKQLRRKKGKLRRTMFAKLRTNRYLKIAATPEGAVVKFASEVSRIAQVHHSGLRDRVSRRSSFEAQYPARPLLGFTEDEVGAVREAVIGYLAKWL